MLVEFKKDDGFYDLEWDEYHAIDAVRHSWLEALRRSPAACKESMQTDLNRDTPSLRIGRALHAAVLEPLTFNERYKPLYYPGNTKKGKEERAELGDATGLHIKEWELLQGMASSLRTHPRVQALLKRATMMEQSAIWTREGRRCKARFDMAGDGWIADYKTTTQVKRFSPYAVTDYGYHRQAAWYLSSYEHLRMKVPDHYYFIVVASTPPHESAMFRLNVESVATGVDETTALFEQFLQCEKDHTWTRHEEQLLTATAFPPRQVEATAFSA